MGMVSTLSYSSIYQVSSTFYNSVSALNNFMVSKYAAQGKYNAEN